MTAHAMDRPVLVGMLLAFAAGFVDTCGFIGLFGLFTAHVTGNFVTIGAAMVEQGAAVIAKLLALPVFILTVAATRLWAIGCRRSERDLRTPLLLAQMLLMAGFMVVGVAASPIASAEAPLAIIAGLLGVAAMAIQNAAARLAFASLAPTTVMTGNITQSVIDAVDLLFRTSGDPPAEVSQRFRKMWPPVLAFAVGAIFGALSYSSAGFICLLAPIIVLGGLATLTRCGLE
ncbi:MAG: DUF1275 domain-containing protein [Proteobacteria bacterium]|nr:DUF1275 domain-containing protein [Pseudomonadota bacterium]